MYIFLKRFILVWQQNFFNCKENVYKIPKSFTFYPWKAFDLHLCHWSTWLNPQNCIDKIKN